MFKVSVGTNTKSEVTPSERETDKFSVNGKVCVDVTCEVKEVFNISETDTPKFPVKDEVKVRGKVSVGLTLWVG